MSEEDYSNLFITEIPLDATLTECLQGLEPFGKIKKFQFVSDSVPHSGRAFVSFVSQEDGRRCLEQSRNSKDLISDKLLCDKGVIIKGVPVVVMVKRDREELLAEKEEKIKDKRDTELLYEGHIAYGDEAAEGVPPEEMAKRKRLFESKLKKMSDTNNKISRTRLAVFNLPPEAGTGRIRRIFAVAPNKYARAHKDEDISKIIKKKSPRITEVRKAEGQDDLAFVEFTTHEHALAALREVNNNPSYFHDRRLIVEFAIENSFATQKMRETKKTRLNRFIKDQTQQTHDQESEEESE